MKRNRIRNGIILSIGHFLVCIFAGAIGWPMQTVIVSVASIIAVYITFSKIDSRFFICMAIIAPFYLLYTPLSISVQSYPTFPIWIMGLICSFTTYILLERGTRPLIRWTLLLFLVLFGGKIVWPNSFAYINTEVSPGRYKLDSSQIVDINGNNISLEELKGKVVLFDIWSSSCSYCIKQFPEVQKLYDKYKDDTLVRIITLNMPLKRDSSFNPSRFLEKYSFDKMFFKTEGDWKKLPIDGVPLTLIMNKKMICQYAGPLNTDWNIFINNANGFIKGLKDEKE